MNPAETAELIDASFGLWTPMGPGNYVLDGVQVGLMGRGTFEGNDVGIFPPAAKHHSPYRDFPACC